MKIISLILIIIGFIISGLSSLGIFYATYTGVSATQTGATRGIADVAWGLSTAYLLSYINIVGFAILGLGVILAIANAFTSRRQQAV